MKLGVIFVIVVMVSMVLTLFQGYCHVTHPFVS